MKIKNKKGFTLVEMLVVIAIIGILMALLFPVFTTVLKKAKRTKAKTEISQVEQAWKAFVMDYKQFPDNLDSMDSTALKHLTGDNDAINERKTLYLEVDSDEPYTDPWQNIYNIKLKTSGKQDAYDGKTVNKQVLVWSFGPDKKENTKDDIKNWN